MEGISWRIGLKLGKEVVATVFVIGTLIDGVTVSAFTFTFGFGVLIAILVIAIDFLYLSSTMEDNGERDNK